MKTTVKLSPLVSGDTLLEFLEGDWHCKGWRIIVGEKKCYVQSPVNVANNEGHQVSKSHFIQRLFNLFEAPTTKEIKDRKYHWSNWQTIAEVNHTFIRQIYLDTVWGTKRKKTSIASSGSET